MKQTFQPNAFKQAVLEQYPRIPERDLNRIVLREAMRPMVAALSVESYIPLAIAAVAGHVRHQHTDYDQLLSYLMRHQARDRVRERANTILEGWR